METMAGACVYLVRENEGDEATIREHIDIFYDNNYAATAEATKPDDVNLMMLLIDQLEETEGGNLNIITPSGSNIQVVGDSVTGYLPGEAPDSDASISMILDMALIAKATREDDSVHVCGCNNETEIAVLVYAAELAGLTVANKPEGFVMPEALKERMDVAWEQRQIDLSLTEPNLKDDVELGAYNDAEVTVTAGLDVLAPTAA